MGHPCLCHHTLTMGKTSWQDKQICKSGILHNSSIYNPLWLYTHACSVAVVMSDSLQPYKVQLASLLCPWDSPVKNIRVGCHTFSSVHGILQSRILEWVVIPSPGDLSEPGKEPTSPALMADYLPLSHGGIPFQFQHWTILK